ncbi:unnamed protein product [Notodromas monacha]|uniref:Uncharacterized protein n=1 Tax=Notodromas monacha TaxID=399045 RepID=A0A7R9G9M2_9CRUS|nr:unnamed protein product [Notodromas monacha]CAG0914407.1 unnamed protein product [Notodromas monacha]
MGSFVRLIRRIFVAWVALVVAGCAGRPGCYPEFSASHSGCLTGSRCPRRLYWGVSAAEKQFIVDEHNAIRADAGAANMIKLQWDDELAFVAQKWADQCQDMTDCSDCRRVARFQVGQNYYNYQRWPDTGLKRSNWTRPLSTWSKQKQSLGQYAIQNFYFYESFSGYSQIVWATTSFVGCGMVKSAFGQDSAKSTYVCNYGPAGNVQGQSVFIPGPACSRCPAGYTACVGGLCQGDGQGLPQQPPPAATRTSRLVFPAIPGTRKFIPQIVRPCQKKCLANSDAHRCDRATIVSVTNCPRNFICCYILEPPVIIPTPVAPVFPQTSSVAAIRRCEMTCVRVELSSFCAPETLDLGLTSCQVGEVCCQPKIANVDPPPLLLPTTTKTTSPPPPVAPTTEKPSQNCTGDLVCVPDQLSDSVCNSFNSGDIDIRSSLPTCGIGSTCCAPKKLAPCPPENACLPERYRTLCDPGSILENTTGCTSETGRVCCGLQSSRDRKPVQPSCDELCLKDLDAVACKAQPSALIPGKVCEDPGAVCCKLDALTSGASITNLRELKRLPCEGNGHCMAAYLKSECEQTESGQRFSDLFSCSDNRLKCCVKHDVETRSLYNSDSSDKFTSPMTKTPCGRSSNAKFPWCWFVEIVNSDSQVLCHGAIVEKMFVTTAASCLKSETKNLFVRAPGDSQKKHRVAECIPHYDYKLENLDNDLSILRLVDEIDLDDDETCILCTGGQVQHADDFFVFSTLSSDGRTFRDAVNSTAAVVESDEACRTAARFAGDSAPKNSLCLRVQRPWCGGKGAVLVRRRGTIDGTYFLAGHLSFPSRTCFASGEVSVFVDARETWAYEFLRATMTVFAAGLIDPSPEPSPRGRDSGDDQSRITDGCPVLAGLIRGRFTIVSCENNGSGFFPLSSRNKTECLQNGTRYKIGTRVSYECDDFYVLRGDAWRVCDNTGNWNGRTPFCESDCGKRYIATELVLGGNVSLAGQWPWMAALFQISLNEIVCGGALIKEKWVLTAAHCLYNPAIKFQSPPEDYYVYLGKQARSNLLDDENVQKHAVKKFILHETYSSTNMDSDLALVELSIPAELTQRVQIVCLPVRYDLSDSRLSEGNNGIVAGWGHNELDQGTDQLSYASLPFVPVKKCREETVGGVLESDGVRFLTANMFCAGFDSNTPIEKYQTVCRGDSGGPIVFQDASTAADAWYVEGVVSFYFGDRPCSGRRPGMYSVFTRIHGALAAEEIADRGKLLKKLQENLQSVFQGADLDFKIRRRANSALLDLLSTENIATVLRNDPAGRNLVERLHKGTDRIIDSLGIPRPVLSRIQSAVHNVFSSTVVDGICYKYFSANHTGCLRDDGTCVKLASGISESEKKEIVQEHNRVRRIVAIGGSLEGSDERGQPKKGFIAYQPKASRMREIRWDDELARLAQKWADRCPAVSDCVECRRVARFRVGQNLIVMNGSSTWTSVIAKWASHRSKFDHDWIYELPGFDIGPELASYAQLVSEGSYLIGCGQARFQASPKHPLYSVHVCNYGPGGLEPGDVVYLPGEPCSRCPQGHTCSENFLCSYQSSTAFIPQKLDKLGTSLSTASVKPIASTSVKPATTIKRCANKCVRMSLISLCDADAINLGITDCADEEVCCQLKRNLAQAFNPFTDAEPEGTTTTTTTTSSMATPISCPHACFPVKFAETLCKPSSFLPNAICPDKDQVCCSIGIKPEAVEPPRPALSLTALLRLVLYGVPLGPNDAFTAESSANFCFATSCRLDFDAEA